MITKNGHYISGYGKIYKIGMRLKCIDRDGRAEHGQYGHILEVAGFKKNGGPCIMWCHGIKGPLGYNDEELVELKYKYPDGNFGITVKSLNYYERICGEWDI